MRISSVAQRLRQDATLVVGLVLAAITAVHPWVHQGLSHVEDAQRAWGVAFIPALAVLLGSLMIHEARKRREAATGAAASAAEAHAMRTRAAELEGLIAFEHAVAESLDLLALRRAIEQHIPSIVGLRDAWLFLRLDGRHEAFHARRTDTSADESIDAMVDTAQRALLEAGAADPTAERGSSPVSVGDHACFPLRVGGGHVGVLGVALCGVALEDAERRLLSASANVLAIAVKNVDLVGQIRDHSLRDALTGCFNRAHAVETLHVELRRAQRKGAPLSVVMLDLDHFKRVNDVHGHLAGDAVLRTTGKLLREALRGSDLKARYGGEEFLLVLPDTPGEAAISVAETLRALIARTPAAVGDLELHVTASLGVTTADPGELSAEAVIARADRALYDAKHAGRDCVRAAAPPGRLPVEPPAAMRHESGLRDGVASEPLPGR